MLLRLCSRSLPAKVRPDCGNDAMFCVSRLRFLHLTLDVPFDVVLASSMALTNQHSRGRFPPELHARGSGGPHG